MTSSIYNADVIIIGGGIHGCSTSLHLAKRGLKPILIEKDYVGRHASGVNAGGVRRLGRALPEVPLAEAALKCWQHIADLVDEDCGFESLGQIKVAETDEELDALKMRRKSVQTIGFEHETIIDQKQLRGLLPAIASHCIGGMFVDGDGHANPYQTVMAFKRKALSYGAQIIENIPVTNAKRHGSSWHIKTSAGEFEAPVLVNAAGAWGNKIAKLLGDHVPLEVQALMLMVTSRMPHFVKPVVGSQGRALSFKQFQNGTVLIGGAYQGRAELDNNKTHLNFKGLRANAQAAAIILPIMQHAQIVQCWAGLEGVMPDAIPVIGQGTKEGIFHAFGFSAHGFALAPIVGSIIADLIIDKSTKLPIDAFTIQRFGNS
jgi:sarcosine oxidase subunit beta